MMPMSREALAYAISCTVFGILIGWMIGTQRTGPARPTPAAPAQASTAAAPQNTPPPLDTQKVAELETRAKAEPENAAVRIEIANLYYDAQKFDQAASWYEAALQITPGDVNASTDLAVCYYMQEQTDRALAQIDRSLQLDGRHAKTLLNQGIIRAWGKQDLKGAAESWEKVLAVAPDTEEARLAQQGLDGIRSAHGTATGAGGSSAGTAGGSGGR
jgi:tetratricopeptide (TPR) repeat protein